MGIVEERVGLKINVLTREKYLEMLSDDDVISNEMYLVKDDPIETGDDRFISCISFNKDTKDLCVVFNCDDPSREIVTNLSDLIPLPEDGRYVSSVEFNKSNNALKFGFNTDSPTNELTVSLSSLENPVLNEEEFTFTYLDNGSVKTVTKKFLVKG